jgi:hypothetical protein
MLVLHISKLICVKQHRRDNQTKDLTTGSPLHESKTRYLDLITVNAAQKECWNHWWRCCRSKDVSGRVNTLPKNLIYQHPCRFLDCRRMFGDIALPQSATQRMKGRQGRKWWCREISYGWVKSVVLSHTRHLLYIEGLNSFRDSICLNLKNHL